MHRLIANERVNVIEVIFLYMLYTLSIGFNDRTSMNSAFGCLLINIVCILTLVYYVCLYNFCHLRANQGQ